MAAPYGFSISSEPWGEAHGREVRLWTLADSHSGLSVRITNYGATVQSVWAPDEQGEGANIVLGFPRLEDYIDNLERQPWPAPGGSGAAYFGAVVGRYANRIADHAFELDGRRYELPANNGPHTLHGGPEGWSMRVWEDEQQHVDGGVGLRLALTDPQGTNGFPGEVHAVVAYSLIGAQLAIDYLATTTAPTVLNLTNHTYFNLAGEGYGTALEHEVRISADAFLPVGPDLIPTGALDPVQGTPFDFRVLKPLGRDLRRVDLPAGEQLTIAHGYDHSFVLGSGARQAAMVIDPHSRRTLSLSTTEPGLQLYTANFLLGDLTGPSGRAYRQGDGVALETQHFPDSPHHQHDHGWPSVVVRPGNVFRSRTVLAFGVGRAHSLGDEPPSL